MNKFHINKKTNPKGLKQNEYDVIIIGAGIGGLTCGCYLAKVGLKVLIIEQHHKPGGYCTSFKRKGFTFDATTHYIGSMRENGPLRKIFNELELDKKIEIGRFDPFNVVVFPDQKIHIKTELAETIFELQNNFKHEAKNIENFFHFLWNSGYATLYTQLRDKTFENLLNMYFLDDRLKLTLGIFLLNLGLPPSKASALTSAIFYREFIIDGGYYPKGGMQVFSDAFANKFKEYGGEIVLGNKVNQIFIKNNQVKGVIIDTGSFISSRTVISNCDAYTTFFELIGKTYLTNNFIDNVNNLEITPSAFIVYLGLNKNYDNILKNRCSWWCFLTTNINDNNFFSDLNRNNKPYIDDFIFCVFPSSHDSSLAPLGSEVVILIVPAKMSNNTFWDKNKGSVTQEIIKRADKIIPDLSNSIVVKETASPLTLHKYTLNKNGAAYGWASTLSQIGKNTMPPTTLFKGLYLVGHWTTLGAGQGGISTAAYCGENVAKLVIKNLGCSSK